MQTVGIVNDQSRHCFRHDAVAAEDARLQGGRRDSRMAEAMEYGASRAAFAAPRFCHPPLPAIGCGEKCSAPISPS
jgi:hypothetical protein